MIGYYIQSQCTVICKASIESYNYLELIVDEFFFPYFSSYNNDSIEIMYFQQFYSCTSSIYYLDFNYTLFVILCLCIVFNDQLLTGVTCVGSKSWKIKRINIHIVLLNTNEFINEDAIVKIALICMFQCRKWYDNHHPPWPKKSISWKTCFLYWLSQQYYQ